MSSSRIIIPLRGYDREQSGLELSQLMARESARLDRAEILRALDPEQYAAFHRSDRIARQLVRAAKRRYGLPDSIAATRLAGSEPLASIEAGNAPAAVANSISELSLLNPTSRSQVGPFSPAYWGDGRSTLRMTGFGTLSVVAATTPTILLKVKQNTANANPVAGAILAGSVANVATATLSGVANAWWMFDLLMQVRATGSAGTILAVGRLHSNIFTATVGDVRAFTNALPPTAVSEDLTLNQFVDLTATWGTANASNTLQLLAYLLESCW